MSEPALKLLALAWAMRYEWIVCGIGSSMLVLGEFTRAAICVVLLLAIQWQREELFLAALRQFGAKGRAAEKNRTKGLD
jgi:hypothetical protein